MCSRYSLTSPLEAVRAYFKPKAGRDHPYPPRYNIAPTQPVSIIRTGADNARELVLVRWGLIPGWVKEPGEFATILNARAETALEKPSFKSAMRHRRCLVPADAFYEWTGPAGAKRPHMMSRATSVSGVSGTPGLLAFAGLWEHWMSKDGSEIETMAIVTVAANATIGTLHDRMPAILPEAAFDTWLDIKNVRDHEAAVLLQPAPDDLLKIEELEPAINSSRAEGPQLQRVLQSKSPSGGASGTPSPQGTLL
jgi:putative SOS response-associated peptidase YedK